MGCDNLKGFHKHDPYFLTVLIALDADVSIPRLSKNTQNIIKLPGTLDSKGQGLSPERTLYAFIQALADVNVKYPTAMAALEAKTLSRNQLQANLLDGASIGNRESAKKWMNAKLQLIQEWGLYELWLREHPDQVRTFEDALVAAAIATAKRI